ncbi:MAG: hypothetical protein CMJ32_11380 [Phycisphaerae bacterium]|nr:hypothetical protein [Phycisphaerae bacterium]
MFNRASTMILAGLLTSSALATPTIAAQDGRAGQRERLDRQFGIAFERDRDSTRSERIRARQEDAPRSMLGIMMDQPGEDMMDGNELVMISGVLEGSPADRAGLRENDIIVAIDGREGWNPESLGSFIASSEPGHRLEMTINRGDRMMRYQVVLAEYDREMMVAGDEEDAIRDMMNELNSRMQQEQTDQRMLQEQEHHHEMAVREMVQDLMEQVQEQFRNTHREFAREMERMHEQHARDMEQVRRHVEQLYGQMEELRSNVRKAMQQMMDRRNHDRPDEDHRGHHGRMDHDRHENTHHDGHRAEIHIETNGNMDQVPPEIMEQLMREIPELADAMEGRIPRGVHGEDMDLSITAIMGPDGRLRIHRGEMDRHDMHHHDHHGDHHDDHRHHHDDHGDAAHHDGGHGGHLDRMMMEHEERMRRLHGDHDEHDSMEHSEFVEKMFDEKIHHDGDHHHDKEFDGHRQMQQEEMMERIQKIQMQLDQLIEWMKMTAPRGQER